jgi:hypothetical protein
MTEQLLHLGLLHNTALRNIVQQDWYLGGPEYFETFQLVGGKTVRKNYLNILDISFFRLRRCGESTDILCSIARHYYLGFTWLTWSSLHFTTKCGSLHFCFPVPCHPAVSRGLNGMAIPSAGKLPSLVFQHTLPDPALVRLSYMSTMFSAGDSPTVAFSRILMLVNRTLRFMSLICK